MGTFIDLTGQKFGRYTVLEFYGYPKNIKNRNKLWKCLCDCGNIQNVQGGHLISGHSKGCKSCSTNATHGLSKHPLHSVWLGMKQRTSNPNNDRFYMYGAVGINICDSWKNDFYTFYCWAIENGYKQGLSIDRIDGTKGYSPDNCRFATVLQQQNNIKTNMPLEIDGVTRNLREWCRIYGVDRGTVSYRIKTKGWSAKKAFETPIKHRREVKSNGLDV